MRNNPGLGAPGGANGQIQFNDSGLFGGVPGLAYDPTSGVLSGGGLLSPIASLNSIPSLIRWYDAQALPVVADSTALASWTDITGGENLVQATGANQPLYRTAGSGVFGGFPCVSFDGVSRRFATAGNGPVAPVTVIAICKPVAVTTGVIVGMGVGTTAHQFTVYPNNPNWLADSGAGIVLDSGIAAIANRIAIIATSNDTINSVISVDGQNVIGKPAIVLQAGPIVVGSSIQQNAAFLSGYIGEIGIYNRALYPFERLQALLMLARKWGLIPATTGVL